MQRVRSRLARVPWGWWVALLVLPALAPLARPGFFESHDGVFHAYRLAALDRAVRAGVLYPRWFPEFAFGYGHPVLNFYGPLSYYWGLPFSLLGADAIAATKLVLATGLVASALGLYAFARLYLDRLPALVAALVEDLVETARRLAARSTGARLDPPMLLALDEIANLSPLPSLPVLMAQGGGTGITTLPVLQSLAQARDKWNENQANALWDAAIVKLILGGASNSKDLQDLSSLIGERDEYTDSVTLGDHGTRSNQRSIRRVPILPPDRLRTLPFGTGIIMLRSAPPIVTNLRSWVTRDDAKTLRADRTEIETLLQRRP